MRSKRRFQLSEQRLCDYVNRVFRYQNSAVRLFVLVLRGDLALPAAVGTGVRQPEGVEDDEGIPLLLIAVFVVLKVSELMCQGHEDLAVGEGDQDLFLLLPFLHHLHLPSI